MELPEVVSKYFGETVKNLGPLFHPDRSRSRVLFFDEAVAPFGKRAGLTMPAAVTAIWR